jgi:streptogramin lyase
MNQDRLIGQVTDWLEEQPTRAPDALLQSVLSEIETAPQRRAWRVRLRDLLIPRSSVARFAVVGAALAIILVGALGLAPLLERGPTIGPEPPLPPPSSPSPTACQLPDPPTDARVTAIEVDAFPGYVVFADCSFWVATTTSGTVQRIDPLTNEVVATIAVGKPVSTPGGTVMALAAEGDDVWAVINNPVDDRGLVRIDPATNTVAERIAVPSVAYSMLILDGRAWLGDFGTNRVVVVDLTSGEVMEEISLGDGPVQIDDGFGAVWGRSGQQLARIDAQTFEVTRHDVPGRAIYVTVSESGIWSASPEGGIFKLSPEGELLANIESEAEPVRSASIDGYVYVGSQISEERTDLLRIDEATGEVVERIELDYGFPEVISAAGGSLWMTAGTDDDARIVRIEVPTEP